MSDENKEKENPNDLSNIENARKIAEAMKEGVSTPNDQNFWNDAERNWFEKCFGYAHLPAHLQTVSKEFHDLADFIIRNLPPNNERTKALSKLLESKDAAVRAKLL